jgi:hypothetical protein
LIEAHAGCPRLAPSLSEYAPGTLEVASGYPASTFEIDWLLAEAVWSIDDQTFEE